MSRVLLCLLALFAVWVSVQGQDYHSGQYESSTSLFGVTYSPFAPDLDTMCLPPAQVRTDMAIIKTVADHVRTYNLANCYENMKIILQFCDAHSMRLIVGLHISADIESNEKELNALRDVVMDYGHIIDAVIVGNQVLFYDYLTVEQLLSYINEAKTVVMESMYNIPVTTAEVWPVYESVMGPRLVRATDFVCMNMHPFWEGRDIICPTNVDHDCASAGEYAHLKAAGLEGYFGKPVWICESGWPTQGERCCEGVPNSRGGLLAGPDVSNSTVFISEVVEGGRKAKRPTYIHAMFDEEWKRVWSPCLTCKGLSTMVTDPSCSTCEVDYHYGIYNYDRTPKTGVVLPTPV